MVNGKKFGHMQSEKKGNNGRKLWSTFEKNKEAYGVNCVQMSERRAKSHIQETKRLHSSVGYYFDDVHSIAPLFYNSLVADSYIFTGHRGP